MRKFTGALAAALLACVVAPLSASAANNPCPRPDTGAVVTSAPHLFSSNGALNASFDYSTTVDSAGPDPVLFRNAGRPAIADIACEAKRYAQLFSDQSQSKAAFGV